MNVSKMNKVELLKVMEEAGMAFSKDLTKKELVKLYNKQEVKEEIAVSNENTNNEEEVEMNELNKEVTEEVIENVEVEAGQENEVVAEEIEDAEVPTVEDAEEVSEENKETSPETPAADVKHVEEEKTNKRKVGKAVDWYTDGEFVQQFPSIKAAATFIKDSMELKHMPFTPIMKSIRQDVDWDAHSFKFADDELQASEEAKYQTETTGSSIEDTTTEEEIVETPEEDIEEVKSEEEVSV